MKGEEGSVMGGISPDHVGGWKEERAEEIE